MKSQQGHWRYADVLVFSAEFICSGRCFSGSVCSADSVCCSACSGYYSDCFCCSGSADCFCCCPLFSPPGE